MQSFSCFEVFLVPSRQPFIAVLSICQWFSTEISSVVLTIMPNCVGITVDSVSPFPDISRVAVFNLLAGIFLGLVGKRSLERAHLDVVHTTLPFSALRNERQSSTDEIQRDKMNIWSVWCAVRLSCEYYFIRYWKVLKARVANNQPVRV